MPDKERKKYCLVDHANKQKDLARLPPYDFWVRQVKRRDGGEPAASGSDSEAVRPRRRAG